MRTFSEEDWSQRNFYRVQLDEPMDVGGKRHEWVSIQGVIGEAGDKMDWMAAVDEGGNWRVISPVFSRYEGVMEWVEESSNGSVVVGKAGSLGSGGRLGMRMRIERSPSGKRRDLHIAMMGREVEIGGRRVRVLYIDREAAGDWIVGVPARMNPFKGDGFTLIPVSPGFVDFEGAVKWLEELERDSGKVEVEEDFTPDGGKRKPTVMEWAEGTGQRMEAMRGEEVLLLSDGGNGKQTKEKRAKGKNKRTLWYVEYKGFLQDKLLREFDTYENAAQWVRQVGKQHEAYLFEMDMYGKQTGRKKKLVEWERERGIGKKKELSDYGVGNGREEEEEEKDGGPEKRIQKEYGTGNEIEDEMDEDGNYD